jgi:hypothetical protein
MQNPISAAKPILIAQARTSNSLALIKNHLSQDPQHKVIDTTFPSLNPVGNSSLNPQDLQPSQYVKDLKFIVREENGETIQKTYCQIRGEDAQTNKRLSGKANIVGIIDGSTAYGIEDISDLPFVGQSNQATLNAHATSIEGLFTDKEGKNTLQGAKLKKLN